MRRYGWGNLYKEYPYQRESFKRTEKKYHLFSQPIFFEASQAEWRKPFNFPTRIPRFSDVNGKYPSLVQYWNFSFIVSELVQVNPDNSLAECINL